MRGRYDLAQQSYYSGAAARRRDPMLVEELVRAPRGMAAAPDYKFFVFGGHVAALWYVQGRHTREECSAWYDAEWTRRLDGHGCVCEGAAYCPPKGFLLQSFHKHSCKTTPRPEG